MTRLNEWRAIRQFLHQSIRDATWGWVIVRIGLVADPLSETIERGVMTDLQSGIRLKRFLVDNEKAAIDLILGTGLMAMRSILEGHTQPDYPEHITKLILKTLGIGDADAHALAFAQRPVGKPLGTRIAFKPLESLPS